MALVPLQAAMRGDFVVLLVPVEDTDTMATVAGKVAHHVINRRLPAREAPLCVQFKGQVLPPDITVAAAGLAPMDFVEVFYAE
ncbi:MAG: toluene monooxygenase [Nitrospiraceae bacterium]